LSDRLEVAGHAWQNDDIALGAQHAETSVAHGLKMRAAREQRDIGTGAGQARSDIAANRAGARDEDPHTLALANACATTRR
jgi:hypothetical protein